MADLRRSVEKALGMPPQLGDVRRQAMGKMVSRWEFTIQSSDFWPLNDITGK